MVGSRIIPSRYQDSVVLMRVASRLREMPGIGEAALFMGSEANKAILRANGLATSEAEKARPEDLIIAVRLDSPDEEPGATPESATLQAPRLSLEEALCRPKICSTKKKQSAEAETRRLYSLDAALRAATRATLVFISLPGRYAAAEARKALRAGKHVFLFSDNVPLEDERSLKQEACSRGLFCMGPDCGSAMLNGIGLGFTNAVSRGRIGLVTSSGTGLQALACYLDRLGEGISHAVGVGGRDCSPEVGALMTKAALLALDADSKTELVIIVSKAVSPGVMADLESFRAGLKTSVLFWA